MLNRSNLHNYQNKLIERIKEKKKLALWVDMGGGKTISTLTAISDLLDDFYNNKILIIAPLRVANTVWKQESEKWNHTKNLNISICTGSKKQRENIINSNFDILVINRENVPWLIENNKWEFDGVVIDEVTSFKNPASKRFKALKKVLKFTKTVITLTGTPTPNGYKDLWSQIFLIDQGERLGRTVTQFRNRFLNQNMYSQYVYDLKPGAENEIKQLISDIVITLDKNDYPELPEKIELNEYVFLDKKLMSEYKNLENEFILNLQNNVDITAPSQATLGMKLLQFCNGAIYDEEKNVHNLHDLKINMLKEIIEENQNENFLIAYNFKHDLDRLLKAFPSAEILSKDAEIINKWNNGKIKILLAYPGSAGHGLNLQKGGSVILWFGLNWNLEYYQQFNARLYRQGQSNSVRIIHLVMKGGIDEKIIIALNKKAKTQYDLLEYIRCNIL